MKRLVATYFAGFVFVSQPVYGGVFSPSSYEDCIIESMRGVTSDRAASVMYVKIGRRFTDA